MAKFKSGKSGNPEGRPKGSVNTITSLINERIDKILSDQFTPELVTEDLKDVKPYERLKLFMRLIEFVVPRMKSAELTVNFEKFTDQDLDRIIDGLISKTDGPKG